MRVIGNVGGWRRRTFVSVGVAAAVVLLTAGTAGAVTGTGGYSETVSTGDFSVLRANNLVKAPVDDAIYALSTTGTGLHRLPFPLHLYNQTYLNVVVSTNGSIQFGVTLGQGKTAFANDCLPTATFGHPAVLPYWDDLQFIPTDGSRGFPQGIFLRTAGTAPHRTFTVSWQGEEQTGTQPSVLAQVIFKEGAQNLSYVYGTSGGAAATIGIQSKQQLSYTQATCDTGNPSAVAPGTRLTFQHVNE